VKPSFAGEAFWLRLAFPGRYRDGHGALPGLDYPV